MKRVNFLFLALLASAAAQAQVLQLSREQLIEYTKENPFDRFPDGRPKVPDDLLKKLESVSPEEVWRVLSQAGYNNQFEGHWQILHPEKPLIGRAVTAQFMPLRKDVLEVAEAKANGSGPKRNANQRVIDSLQNGDAIVVDLYGKEEGGTYVGDNLATAIETFTHNGFVVDGAIRDLDSIFSKGMPVYIRSSHPTPINNCMLTGVNIPIRIGGATVMPGDVVFGTREGIYFIPPQFVKQVIETSEELHVHDEWTQMMLKTGKYKSSDIYPSPRDPELKKQYEEYKRQHLGR
ncbi:MAG: RraA family protein [Acidobacteriaceae bacterium]|nr:RraA family protein [Acidobacteriaceae bacterium]